MGAQVLLFLLYRKCTWKPWCSSLCTRETHLIAGWEKQNFIVECNGWLTGMDSTLLVYFFPLTWDRYLPMQEIASTNMFRAEIPFFTLIWRILEHILRVRLLDYVQWGSMTTEQIKISLIIHGDIRSFKESNYNIRWYFFWQWHDVSHHYMHILIFYLTHITIWSIQFFFWHSFVLVSEIIYGVKKNQNLMV